MRIPTLDHTDFTITIRSIGIGVLKGLLANCLLKVNAFFNCGLVREHLLGATAQVTFRGNVLIFYISFQNLYFAVFKLLSWGRTVFISGISVLLDLPPVYLSRLFPSFQPYPNYFLFLNTEIHSSALFTFCSFCLLHSFP